MANIINVNGKYKTYDKFKVTRIGYNLEGSIVELEIQKDSDKKDEKDMVVFKKIYTREEAFSEIATKFNKSVDVIKEILKINSEFAKTLSKVLDVYEFRKKAEEEVTRFLNSGSVLDGRNEKEEE